MLRFDAKSSDVVVSTTFLELIKIIAFYGPGSAGGTASGGLKKQGQRRGGARRFGKKP
jgi:hypothetical protein